MGFQGAGDEALFWLDHIFFCSSALLYLFICSSVIRLLHLSSPLFICSPFLGVPSFLPPSWQRLRQVVAIGELVSLPVVVLAALMVSHVCSCIVRVGGVEGGRLTARALLGVLDALAPALAYGNPLGRVGRVWVCAS